MKKMNRLFASLFLIAACSIAWAQATKPAEPRTVTEVLDRSLSRVEKQFVSAADAMPDDKYSFAPTNGEFKGVRTFAQQVKHVAAVNYMVAGAVLGEKPPVELASEDGPDSIKTKADALKFLKDSFAYMHKATMTVDATNMVEPIKNPFGDSTTTRLAMAAGIVGHCFDHYGQMVEYLRMNGIIPPASR